MVIIEILTYLRGRRGHWISIQKNYFIIYIFLSFKLYLKNHLYPKIMQKPSIQISVYIFIIICLLEACGGSKPETASSNERPNPSDSIQVEADSSSALSLVRKPEKFQARRILLTSDDRKEVVQIDLSLRENIITYNQQRKNLVGERKANGKFLYFNNLGDWVAKVNYSENGFKLKDHEEKLLWKVKIQEDKIKIAKNEDLDDPIEITQNQSGKFKLKYQKKTLGDLTFKSDTIKAKGQRIYFIPAKRNHPAYTMLLAFSMSQEHRLIILAELLRSTNL